MGVLIVFFICLLCVYLAIGYTSSILIGAEDDTHVTIIFTLFWPAIWTFLIIFCIVFTFIGRSSIKKIMHCNMWKIVRKNKSYDKRKLVIYDNNDKKIVEVEPWGGWFCWSNNSIYKKDPDSWKLCRLEVLKNLYWLIGKDCDEFEWNQHIEHLDSGLGVDGKTEKYSQFFNIDEKLIALESFNK